MSRRWLLSRRTLLTSTAALIAARSLGTAGALAQEANSDRGIGGTGVAPTEPGTTGDRGIGGTGVIGTIRRFGSIYVNDLHITFPRSVAVLIDERRANLGDLRLGHVVGVLAERRGGRLTTALISVTSEVVGPVEAVRPGRLTVLGQEIQIEVEAPTRGNHAVESRWAIGDVVAVSGLRRLDGTIVASLIERRRPGQLRVSGPAVVGRSGTVRIGSLPIAGLRPSLLGRRVSLTGHLSGGVFRVERAEPSIDRLLAHQPTRLSIEAYVAQARDAVQLGSGLDVHGDARAAPTSGDARAIVTAAVGPDGDLRLESVRFERDRRGSRGGGHDAGPAGSPAGPGAAGPVAGAGPQAQPGPPGFGPQGFGPQGFGPQGFGPQGFGPPGQLGPGFGPPGGPLGQASPSGDPSFGAGRFGSPNAVSTGGFGAGVGGAGPGVGGAGPGVGGAGPGGHGPGGFGGGLRH